MEIAGTRSSMWVVVMEGGRGGGGRMVRGGRVGGRGSEGSVFEVPYSMRYGRDVKQIYNNVMMERKKEERKQNWR